MIKLQPADACLVCGGRSDGAHFGAIEACSPIQCRACTAFFRRIVSRDKEYVCSDGGNCIIDPKARNICRGCRFDRCLAVGMQTKNVQRRRDGLGRNNKLPDCSPSTSEASPESKPMSLFISEEEGMPILRRVHTQYSQLKGIRKVVHLGEVAGLIADFAFCSFRAEFADMDKTQQKVLFQLFFPTFLSFECAFMTALSGQPDRMVLTNGDYVDTKALSTFYDTKKDGKPVDTEQAVRLFSPTIRYLTDHCTLPIMEQGLDEYEFYALSALCLWDYDHEIIMTETRKVGQEMRKQIIREMMFDYRNIRRYTNETQRLAELLLFITPIQRMGKRIVEDIEIAHLFNIYKYDETMYDIISISSKVL